MYTLLINLIIVNFVVIYRQHKWLAYLFKKYIKPFLTWRILIIYIPIWFIVSGWSMVGIVIGKGWFRAVSISWQTFLWMPWCPEKLVTIPLTIWLHTKIFPNHSVASLSEVLRKEQQDFKEKRKKWKKRKGDNDES